MDNLTNTLIPFDEVDQLVRILQERIISVLGEHLVGLYLDGSLACGGFDSASDIDFVAVTESEVSEALFTALRQMHAEIGQLDLRLSQDIEGYYVSREALRRYDPKHARFSNIERGLGEQLKWVDQDQYWIVHRYILREYGVVLSGPPLTELIDPISPDDLRRTMGHAMKEWGGYILGKPELVAQAGYQSYAVLTICRILYTLEMGDIVAKAEAAQWAMQALGERWRPLIEAALVDRIAGRVPTKDDTRETLAFLDFSSIYEREYWRRTGEQSL